MHVFAVGHRALAEVSSGEFMKSLSIDRPVGTPGSDGKRFDLTLHQERNGNWHWLMAVPGELVLSGSAPSESAAMDRARSAAKALTRPT